jgi:replicative DNA helicase
LSVLDIRARCRRLKSKEKKLDLIIVDYLQLMRGPKTNTNGGNREQEISAISRGLKELAKELGVPIIALSQLSRNVENRTDKRPMLSDLRESGAIEQDADMVCFIYRDDYYNPDSDEKGVAELIIAKNRHGEPGTAKLAWMGQYTLFANLTAEGAPPAAVVRRPGNANSDDYNL